MILYRFAGLTDEGDRDEMTLLDAALQAHKCGLTLTGAELLDLSPAEAQAMVRAWNILFAGDVHPRDRLKGAVHSIAGKRRAAGGAA